MTIRDLGYKPYEGVRLPPKHNTIVMLRHGLSRAWGSWLVKIAGFLCWVPTIIALFLLGGRWWLTTQVMQGGGGGMEPEPLDGGDFVHSLLGWQVWLFCLLVTLGAGASAISEDLAFRAFQFYFAKPVTPPQYLFGRILAVAIWVFSLTFFPALIVILVIVGTAPEDLRLESLGLLFPALVHSVLISAVMSVGSVAVSALSNSRALTMSSWILLFVVPWVLATIVFEVGEWPWLKLVSIPALLGVVGDALFKVAREDDLSWWYALPILVGFTAGGLWYALQKLRKAEVIT